MQGQQICFRTDPTANSLEPENAKRTRRRLLNQEITITRATVAYPKTLLLT
jgi:hypothetical protein